MRTHRSKHALFVLSLLTTVLLTGSTHSTAASVTSTVTVPISGVISGGPAENVSLSGSVQIVSTLVLDPLLGSPPRERLSIKLVNVSGVGLSTGARYVATGEDAVLRLLKVSDLVEIAFPFYRDTPNGRSSARSALAGITLQFNLLTGALTGATASFSTPNFSG
jgi:hypothetical protein